MRRVGFIPDKNPMALPPVPSGAGQEDHLHTDTSNAATEPAAAAKSESDAEPDKKPAGRKPRSKAEED